MSINDENDDSDTIAKKFKTYEIIEEIIHLETIHVATFGDNNLSIEMYLKPNEHWIKIL